MRADRGMNSKITGSRYVLAVNNLVTSSDFYKNKLGFQTIWEGGGWHFLIRDNIKIMLENVLMINQLLRSIVILILLTWKLII